MPDNYFMKVALQLAKKNLGNVAPNPAVGCVIVKNNMIIGKGYTGIGGRPHAEVFALQSAQETHGATMYTTLEPCCHYGVTNPCTMEIIKSGIKKVVIAATDPDKRVSGNGIKILKEAGIDVTYGIMKEEAEKLNIGFFYVQKLNRPFIACKIATTLDGKIATATGKSKWITANQTRNWVHRLRAEYDAIMIGSNTLTTDDPLLTCRLPGLENRSPIRFIVDSQNKLRKDHNIAKTAEKIKTWVITNKKIQEIENISYLTVDSNNIGKVCLRNTMFNIATKIGVTRLLVEGGGILITELLKHQLIDRLIICRSGKILGNDAIPFITDLKLHSINECYEFEKVEIIDCSNDVIEIWDNP
ncbi:bifunctional diaminohydroxyphosphoribosylaminopyrimidine deaminase/5-amino-6-(5-phosphoribosylamino)uracil reductase RibD [Wolbachia endosymbiont of Pentidionis agamae]|uniref:bifunctional diaminohydroxyphosphoribosylaminopyrimidine deaminase/5-amino-6-(5-phosphoribosylamino)uracil reductase RibD n=1 Tax=Wolbachia endosymbiont of Pentidionis agamae TaxID=3110435 RepID=UPI002FD48AAF